MKSAAAIVPALLAAALLQSGCGSKASGDAKSPPPAAKVENRVKETDLTKVTLSPEAAKRLGIELAEAIESHEAAFATIAGEILLIPGKALMLASPVAGTVHLLQPQLSVGHNVRQADPVFRITPLVGAQRDLRITWEADLRTAKARLDNASLQLERARQLVKDLAGSQRNVDAAEQEFGQAKAAHEASAQRLQWLQAHPYDADVDLTLNAPATGVVRQLNVSDNQPVSAGAALLEVADLGRVWLRVPVYAGDSALASAATVKVQDIGGKGPTRTATRVAAPPTADPLAATTDVYYELANANLELSPGRRMNVLLPARPVARNGVLVPASALVYDIQGGAWVYVADPSPANTFHRQRVELAQTSGASAILSRGLAPGAKVVIAGVAELFGTEFGAGK
ncbi:MAG: efflux RND transporter periplasmic adaptor subunit [Bryobacteraceae bacterium]|nr:efflux RND transporter periplasmic adaptor subunit [Bryobacteraceae bacterium]